MTIRSAQRDGAGSRTAGRRRTTATPSETEEIVARAARLGITVERAVEELRRIAFADPSRLFEPDGEGGYRLKPLSEVDPELFAAIQEIVPGDAGHARVKFYDKRPILEALARYLGILPAAPRPVDVPAEVEPEKEARDPREFLIRELARLAGETGEGAAVAGAEDGRGPQPSV